MKEQNIILRIFSLLSENKRGLIALALLTLLSSGLEISVPLISQKLIDSLVNFFKDGGQSPINVLVFSIGGILIATLSSKATNSFYQYKLFIITTKLTDRLRFQVYEKYLRLHALFHHSSSSGQTIGRIERGTNGVYAIVNDIIGLNLFPPLTFFLSVLLVLAIKNPLIALIVFAPFPVYVFAVRKISQKIYELEKDSNEAFEAVTKEEYDVASNIHTVKKFSQEAEETKKQIRLQNKARSIQYKAERLWAFMENIQTLVAVVGRVLVILIAGMMVLNKSSSIGEFVLFITLQNMAYEPLWRLSNIIPRFRRNSAKVERLFNLMDEKVAIEDAPNAIPLPPLSENINFENVWFRYGEHKSWVLKNINLSIKAGTSVALVGRSGSGKTTFINLLLRSFDPSKGSIRIDGHDLRQVTQDSLRSQMAIVPQEVDLFSRTIYENISYGRKEASKKELERAAKVALAHSFINKLEKKYDTTVGERGIKLSGGERQRIGIARAILRDPSILILDEATSHLDTESERLIQRATKAIIKERTSFIIAHRLSTVLHADLILVFHSGEIEASGTHKELMKTSPTYKLLYRLQFNV